ncbi:MAG: hypothetical protein QNJ51_16140 [Calothrix sp. MO_167.B12]|nr:hypothetical protein [Calothrix sp. MO_167.B12]
MADIIRVMVVAASPAMRMGLSAMLDDNPNLTVVKTVPDMDSLTEEMMQLQPDVVLLDWDGNDYEAISHAPQFLSATIILIDDR